MVIDDARPNLDMLGLQVTQACDKACSMCCMSALGPTRGPSMDFAKFRRVISRLHELGIRGMVVGITGGEPLLFESYGNRLSDMISYLNRLDPAQYYIQTSGAGPAIPDFDRQVLDIRNAAGGCHVRWATSYTLYQRVGIDDRMAVTINRLASEMVPHPLEIHLTADPMNQEETGRRLTELMRTLGFSGYEVADRGFYFTRKDESVAARYSATVAAGRANSWSDLSIERPSAGCYWLSQGRRTMHILTNGDIHLCCTPEAYRNPTFALNVFKADPALFFSVAPRLSSILHNVITGNSGPKLPTGRCERCNLVDHATGYFRDTAML